MKRIAFHSILSQLLVVLVVFFALMSNPTEAKADPISFVTSRGALAGDKSFDWAVLGPPYTGFGNGRLVSSNPAGVTATLTESGIGADGFMQTRWNDGVTWLGNFAPGDALLWTFGVGSLTISFDVPVFGAGAQIMDGYGNFVGQIRAFDASNNLLGSFTLNGVSTAVMDNSAIFLGVLDNTPSIKWIEFTTNTLPTDQRLTMINRLDIVTTPIPEPTSLLLLGTGLGSLALTVWRRRKA